MTGMTSYPHVEDYIELLAGYEPGRQSYSIAVWSTSPTRATALSPKINLARYDVNVIGNMASATMGGTALTDKQAVLACKIVLKYQRQLAKYDISIDPIIASPKYRMAIRNLDRTKRAWIEDDEIRLKFPYSPAMVQQARDYASEAIGKMAFDPAKKVWTLGLTEPNVVWTTLWSQANEIEVDQELVDYLDLIQGVEAQPYEIQLTKDTATGNLAFINAEESLVEYVNTHLGGLEPHNLTNLVDYAGILGYTIDPTLRDQVDPAVYGFGGQQHTRRDPTLPELECVLRYAKAARRYPVMIFNPGRPFDDADVVSTLTKVFAESEIAFTDLAGNIKGGKTIACVNGEYSVKVIYSKKLPQISLLETIPLFVTYHEMMFGTNKQIWLGKAERIVYMSETKLRNA